MSAYSKDDEVCLAEVRVNAVVVLLWCAERWSWSKFSNILTCGVLFLCLFGLSVFMFVRMCVFMSVLAVFLMLAVLAMLFHQLLGVCNLVDGVLRILAVFETEVMRVQDYLL